MRDLIMPRPTGSIVARQRPAAGTYAQPPLPLSWNDSGGQVTAPPPAARVVRRAGPPGPVRSGGLPEPGAWVVALMQSVREVLAGDRSRGQLRRWVGAEVYDWLGTVGCGAGTMPLGSVRSVHLCEPRRGVVEATVVVGSGPGVRAVAVRLDAVHGSWRCSELAVL